MIIADGRIIYNAHFGFGIVRAPFRGSELYEAYTVQFSDGTVRNLLADSVTALPEAFVTYLEKHDFSDNNAQVSNLRLIPSALKLSASVRDQGLWICSVDPVRSGYPVRCSCGGGKACTHGSQLMAALRRIILSLKQTVYRPEESDGSRKKSVDADAEALAEKICEKNAPVHILLREYIERIGAAPGIRSRLEGFLLLLLKKHVPALIMDECITALAYSESSASDLKYLMEQSRERGRFSAYMRCYTEKANYRTMMDYRVYRVRPRERMLYYFYNRQNEELYDALNEYQVADERLRDIEKATAAELKDNPMIRERFIKDIRYWINIDRAEIMMREFPADYRRRAIRMYPSHFRLHAEDLSDASAEERSWLLTHAAPDPEYTKLLLGEMPEWGEERRYEAAAVLIHTAEKGRRMLSPAAENALKAMPKSRYLRKYLQGERLRNSPGKTYGAEDIEQLLYYFPWRYRVDESEDFPLIYELTETADGPVLLSVREKADGNALVLVDVWEKGDDCPFAAAFYAYARERALPEARALQEKRRAERDLKEKRRKEKALGAAVDALCIEMAGPRVRQSEAMQARLEFSFTQTQIDTYQYALTLKLGISRMYVVKNILAFLKCFDTAERVSYGKELILTHEAENFCPVYRGAILLLRIAAENLIYPVDKRRLLLSEELFGQLIASLRGETVRFDERSFRIAEEVRELKPLLDARYALRLEDVPKGARLLNAGSRMFLLNPSDGVLEELAGNRERFRLLCFAEKHRDMPLTTFWDTFRDKILAPYLEEFKVDGAIREKLNMSNMTAEAYFDWEDGTIPLRLVCRVGEEETDPAALTLPMDISRFRALTSYLTQLGFTEETAGSPQTDPGLSAKRRILENESRVLAFLRMDFTELKKLARVYLSDSLRRKTVTSFVPQPIRIRFDNDLCEAFLEKSSYTDAELARILKALKQKKKYVLLSGDRIVDLDSESAAEFGEAALELGLDAENTHHPKQLSVAVSLRALAHENACRMDDYLRTMIDRISRFKELSHPLPKVEAELRTYQKEGYEWLRTLADYRMGGILADDMGLGKTLEMITLLASDQDPAPSLVVCPKSLVFNWINEFRRFDPSAEVCEIYGSAAERRARIEAIRPDEKVTYITSYDSLRNDREYYSVPFRYLILDEAQYIKNVAAQKSQTVKRLEAVHRFALTGTPIENNVLDLWSIFDFILPGYFDSLADFRYRYTHEDDYEMKIARRIAPFVLRRTKKDVLTDLPEKYERILTAEMRPEQRLVYDAFTREAREKLEGGAGAFDVLPYLMRLRQICDDPSLFSDNYQGGSGKMDALLELIEDYRKEGRRMLVFSQFVQGLKRVEKTLSERKIAYFRITGDTPAKERIRLMNEFNASDEIPVFLISLKAGGTGLNLIGADTVIHLDPWWNVAAENQAADRAHRIGQTRQVEVIKLICENSIEQKVIELQNMKKELAARLISDSDASVTGIGLEDIAFLLR